MHSLNGDLAKVRDAEARQVAARVRAARAAGGSPAAEGDAAANRSPRFWWLRRWRTAH